jgi:hypothetical protein
MGRKKKYKTEEEQRQANRDKAMKYYLKNKAECQRKALERYHKNKTTGDVVDEGDA